MLGDNCLFRWSLGLQDTVSLNDYETDKYRDMLWLAKLSIKSFQTHFPSAQFILLYNGHDFDDFQLAFMNCEPDLDCYLMIIDQRNSEFKNPYHFAPRGVWWKWIPWRLDVTKHEISVDTDIICLSRPTSWEEWLDGDKPILIAPERYETVMVNTCGDFHKHILLRGKQPFNCGIVGQLAGYDFSERFFEITREVKFGNTHNSLFITEQGAINLWVRSLEVEGVDHFVLNYEKNAWIRDFLYFASRGITVETVHAVTWHKKIVRSLSLLFERKVSDLEYDQATFIADLLAASGSLDGVSRHVLSRQMLPDSDLSTEFLLD